MQKIWLINQIIPLIRNTDVQSNDIILFTLQPPYTNGMDQMEIYKSNGYNAKFVCVKNVDEHTVQRFVAAKNIKEYKLCDSTSTTNNVLTNEFIRFRAIYELNKNQIIALYAYTMDAIQAIVNGECISDEFPILQKIQNKFMKYLDLDLEGVYTPLFPSKHIRSDPTDLKRPLKMTRELFEFIDLFLNHFDFSIEIDFDDFQMKPEYFDEMDDIEPTLPMDSMDLVLKEMISKNNYYTRILVSEPIDENMIQQLIEYTHNRVIIDTNHFDIMIVGSSNPETQHASLNMLWERLENGGFFYFVQPHPNTQFILQEWQNENPIGSLYCSLKHIYDSCIQIGNNWIQKN